MNQKNWDLELLHYIKVENLMKLLKPKLGRLRLGYKMLMT